MHILLRHSHPVVPAYALLLALPPQEEAQAAAAAKRSAQGGGGGGGNEAVSIRGMVGPRHGGLAVEETAPQLTEVRRALFRLAFIFEIYCSLFTHASTPRQGNFRLDRLEPVFF